MYESLSEQAKSTELDKLRRQGASFFKDFYPLIDREIMGKLLKSHYMDLAPTQRPQSLQTIHDRYQGDFDAYAIQLIC